MWLLQLCGGLPECLVFCILNVDSFRISKKTAYFLFFSWLLMATLRVSILSYLGHQSKSLKLLYIVHIFHV